MLVSPGKNDLVSSWPPVRPGGSLPEALGHLVGDFQARDQVTDHGLVVFDLGSAPVPGAGRSGLRRWAVAQRVAEAQSHDADDDQRDADDLQHGDALAEINDAE